MDRGALARERGLLVRPLGNVVVLIGAKTGRDGIGGVSVLASATFDDGSVERQAWDGAERWHRWEWDRKAKSSLAPEMRMKSLHED